VSFLNQLKSQATALKREQNVNQQSLDESRLLTEAACKRAWHYLDDLGKQLNVIAPQGPRLSLDGKNYWPDMQLKSFRLDARKKMLRNQEVYDFVGMWWRIVPKFGNPVDAEVSANFPPDLQRIESRLSMGSLKHERKEVRHPEKNTLLAIKFLFETETRGSVNLTPDHDNAQIAFRVNNARGFEVVNRTCHANEVTPELLDELAKLMLGHTTRFAP
jgi:hypothetical protein